MRLLSAPGATEAYYWGDRNLEFHRCRACGCVTHWKSADEDASRTAINGRLLDPADIAEVLVRQSEGPPS